MGDPHEGRRVRMKVGSSGSSDDDDYDIEADQINLLRRQNSVRRFSNWVRKL